VQRVIELPFEVAITTFAWAWANGSSDSGEQREQQAEGPDSTRDIVP